MSEYNLFAGVNADFEFPPEVRQALIQSLNIRNVGAPMTTAERNAINTANLDPGYYIFNTQTQQFQIWRADFEEWHDGLESPGSQKWWPGSTIPAGWFKQDARSLPRAKYFALFAQIGTTYGGSGTPTHFNLPNPGGRVMIDVNADHHLGKVGGEDAVQLLLTHMPKHKHAGSSADSVSLTHQHDGTTHSTGEHFHYYDWITTGSFNAVGDGGNAVYRGSRGSAATTSAGDHSHTFWTNNATQAHGHALTMVEEGGDTAHNNMQKFMAGHFIIKY